MNIGKIKLFISLLEMGIGPNFGFSVNTYM